MPKNKVKIILKNTPYNKDLLEMALSDNFYAKHELSKFLSESMKQALSKVGLNEVKFDGKLSHQRIDIPIHIDYILTVVDKDAKV